MATGIGLSLALGALALLLVTFRSGIALYHKLLGWLVFAGLGWFYKPEILAFYSAALTADYRLVLRDFAASIQIAIPVVACGFAWLALIASSATDAGRILSLLFLLFAFSATVKLFFLA